MRLTDCNICKNIIGGMQPNNHIYDGNLSQHGTCGRDVRWFKINTIIADGVEYNDGIRITFTGHSVNCNFIIHYDADDMSPMLKDILEGLNRRTIRDTSKKMKEYIFDYYNGNIYKKNGGFIVSPSEMFIMNFPETLTTML